jgi:hypothetical protein
MAVRELNGVPSLHPLKNIEKTRFQRLGMFTTQLVLKERVLSWESKLITNTPSTGKDSHGELYRFQPAHCNPGICESRTNAD